ESLVRQGKFREDLFYRLNVVPLWVPPLRARLDDVEPLALHFCSAVASANGRRPPALEAEALDVLRQALWPGNVRQLENFIERLVVLAESPRIPAQDVQRELAQKVGTLAFAEAAGLAPKLDLESSALELEQALHEAARRALDRALRRAAGNKNL